MAGDYTDGDYLGAYSRFFAEFVARVNPDDQLPVSVSAYDMTESEIVGGIIGITLQYLNQTHCPPSLQAHIVRQVIQELQTMCKKQPEECGLRPQEKTYAPLKLMRAVTSKVNEICTRYLDNSRLALLPPPPTTPFPHVEAGGLRNGRRRMEDRHVVLHDLHTIFSIQDDSIANFYAVFDGHGGQDAAVYCATHLPQYLAESIHYPTDPERALHDAFLTTDAKFTEKSKQQNVHGGSTAICTLLVHKKLYVAWVGDSSAILVRRGHVTQLVNPHCLNRADEVQRVTKMGGHVASMRGILRVNGMLAVSRAIGDVQYKPFITGEPETECIPLDGTEDFMVIASDGLWDVIPPDEVASIVYQEIRQQPNALRSVYQSLLQCAGQSGSTDNITIILVFLTPACEIAERPQNAYLLQNNKSKPNDPMNNMDPNNPFLSNANGLHETANGAYIKQVPAHLQHLQHLQQDQNGDDEQMDDNHIIYGTASNGKHENGDADYDYSDLGPETNVDTIDEVVPTPPVKNLSYELYAADADDDNDDDDDDDDDSSQEEDVKREEQQAKLIEDDHMDVDQDVQMVECGAGDHDDKEFLGEPETINANYNMADGQHTDNACIGELHIGQGDVVDDAAPVDYESEPASLQDTKPLQDALIPEADNVADSEDSEDEWNYYRVDPNKRKDSAALIDEQLESQEQQETPSPQPEDSTAEIQSPDVERDIKCESPTEVESPEHIDTETCAEVETEEETRKSETFAEEQHLLEGMDFQLNPDAKEFVPGSPQLLGARMNLAEDFPISGSPLKQLPAMDDIQIPSQSEFEKEVCQRPRDIEEEDKECTNGDLTPQRTDYTDFMINRQRTVPPANMDDSEISSTKAEFGDESASFLTASEFHRTGVSMVDDSFANSERDYDIAKDPMAMSFTPSDFEALDKGVDLNAVHDLTGVQQEDKNGTLEDESIEFEEDTQIKLNSIAPSETEEIVHTPVRDVPEQGDLLNMESQLDEEESTFVDRQVTEEAKDEVKSSEQSEQQDVLKSEQSPPTDYLADFESEKEPVPVDNEQPLLPSSTEVEDTKPIDTMSEDIASPVTESQKDSDPKDENTPSSLSPVRNVEECTTPEKVYDLMFRVQSMQISSTPITSSSHHDAPKFMPEHYAPYSSTNIEATIEHAEAVEEEQAAPEPVATSESVEKEELKVNLLDFDDDRDDCTIRTGHHMEAELTPPLSPQEPENKLPVEPEIVPEVESVPKTEEDTMETQVCELQDHREMSYSGPCGLYLSDSVQEFTGLEKQLQPEYSESVETKATDVEPEPRKEEETKDIVEKEKESLPTTPQHEAKAEESVPEIGLKTELVEPEVEKQKDEVADHKPEKEIAAVFATAVAVTTAAASVTAVAKAKTKPMTKPAKTTPSKTTAKATPVSPSKTANTATRTSTTVAAKKPTPIARPKETDAVKKPTAATTTSKVTASKPTAAPRTSTTTGTKTATRTSMTTTRSKPSTGASKPASATTEKKPTANGEVKSPTKPVAPKTVSRTSVTNAATTAKTSLVKSSTTTRTVTATAASKARPVSAAANAKATTVKSSTTTNTSSTSAARPKSAPVTSTMTKPRTSTTAKAPLIDKQIKETANKQISARTSSSVTNKASTRTSITSTTTTSAKRTSSARTAPATGSPTKKPITATKVTGRTSSVAKGGSTVSKTTKVVQNGVSDAEITSTTIISSDNKVEDDIPKKDLSPVVAPTDNQLIVSSD